MQLKDLECFLTLPGAFPLTKLEFTYHDLPYAHMRFVTNHNDGRTVHVAQAETEEGQEAIQSEQIRVKKTTKELKNELKQTDQEIE